MRSRCLTILCDRTASPAELAVELREDIGNINYHVNQLVKAGAVELVEERPARGAIEHFYKAIIGPYLRDDDFAELTIKQRDTFSRRILSMVTSNASTALEAQTFAARSDMHISRVPLRVDEQGWKELSEVYDKALERIFDIHEGSAERRAAEDDPGIPVVAFSTFFEMPETEPRTPWQPLSERVEGSIRG
ncbi:MAG TPA: hypothetical protein VGV69_10275 [Solirubrobacterales bacterium]|nr:hypothetical protein [Solirubrobacterales bacterium]